MAYTKGSLLYDGGEGFIYEVTENPDLLMKIYKETDMHGNRIASPELYKKLEFMKRNPPMGLIAKGAVAWPIDVIVDKTEDGNMMLGFIMPRLKVDEHLLRIYSYRHPVLDEDEYDKFPSVKSRIAIGINLCSALQELHAKGYVIGDFNHENIGVDYSTGQVRFMDCDSFHLTDDEGTIYRTNVCMAGYLAPEIIRHCNNERTEGNPHNLDSVTLPTFTVHSDNFCLALHIFKLLMNGVDPFRGIKSEATGCSTASPFVGNEAIERNAYVYKEGNKASAVFCPPAESLQPQIVELFQKAFIEGRSDPSVRPNATLWYNALYELLSNGIMQCASNEKHHYFKHLPTCPYCKADNKHYHEQTGFITKQYKVDPAVLLVQSAHDVVAYSRGKTQTLYIITSLILWVSTAIVYIVWNVSGWKYDSSVKSCQLVWI